MGLADELVQRGHEIMVVSLRDNFVKTPALSERQVSGGLFYMVRRVPSHLPWVEGVAFAKEEIDRFGPEWVSIQFVTYTYNPKGLVHGLYGKLAPLLAGRKLHVMFHEVWRGAQRGALMKERLMGFAQKYFYLSFVRQAKPAKCHTSNPAYLALLARNGIKAGVLPLFGNIAIEENSSGWMKAELTRAGVTEHNRKDFCVLGIFGSIPVEWNAEQFLRMVKEAAGKANKQVLLLTAGSLSADAAERLQKAARELSVKVVGFGPQPQERLSEFLQSLDYGVATTSWGLLGKSGAVAAMVEHGLPVLVLRDDVDLGVIEPGSPRYIKMEGNWVEKMQEVQKLRPRSSRPEVVQTFLRDLEINETARPGATCREPVVTS